MTQSAQTLPYAAAPPSAAGRGQLIPMLGKFAIVFGSLRLAAVALLVGWPLLLRSPPMQRPVPGRSMTPAPVRVAGAAAEAVGAALLVAGGVWCVRGRPAGRRVVMWAAAVLLLGIAWGAATQLLVMVSVAPAGLWPVALLAVGQPAAWEAAFPALLWAVCRRAAGAPIHAGA